MSKLEQNQEIKRHVPLMAMPQMTADQPLAPSCLYVGNVVAEPWRSATFDGMRHKLSVHIMRPDCDYETAKFLSDLIIADLHGTDLPLLGHALIDLSLAVVETREKKGCIECCIEFDALTIAD